MIKKSLRNRLIIAFIIVGLLPYIFFVTYTFLFSEKKIINEIVVTQIEKTNYTTSLINNHLESLIHDVKFLSNLDMMNDILSEDIDKRLSNTLIQKVKDYNLDIDMIVINTKYTVVASSNTKLLLNKFSKKYTFASEHGYFIELSKLYIYSKIFASFDTTKQIGILIMSYNLKNLNQFLTNQKEYHCFLANPAFTTFIGKKVDFNINISKEENSIITNDNVIVYKKLSHILVDWYIVYAVNKTIALSFLFDLINLISFLLPLSLLIIIAIALKYSAWIVQPIEKLTHATEEIIKTKNYTNIVEIKGKDEITKLSNSFNKMTQTTNFALRQLEEENKFRLTRFVQLINFFNTIIQTNNEEECLHLSIDYLKTLTKLEEIHFVKHSQDNTNYIHLHVNDFEKSKKWYFGSITLNIKEFEDKNEQQFYYSVATMITLQLDRIKMINTTVSVSNAKSAFISHISHELRTPLSAIMGYTAYLINYEMLLDEQLDIISNIDSSAHYLLSMINETLDIAKIEAGKMEVYFENIDALELTKSVYNMILPLAQSKEISLTIDNAIGEFRCNTDPKIFKQILINLLSNAIKFTSYGVITITLSCDKERINISIIDTGIGISEENLKILFHDFIQIKNSSEERQEGTGLGLSLSKRMAHLLNGDIYLKSDGIDKGTCAYFYIMLE